MSGGAENEASGDVASVSGDPKIVALVNCMASSSESDEVIIQGCDFIVRGNGGSTHPTTAQTGKGNLIVGHNEGTGLKTGLNNIIVGSGHTYTSTGGAVFGRENTISAASATVTGGYGNTASGESASVSGGKDNTASRSAASVSGGNLNIASGFYSSVSGGWENIASNGAASVSGGFNNTANGYIASVSGGKDNTASTDYENLP